MNQKTELDHELTPFESQLLTELRERTYRAPAPQHPAPVRRPSVLPRIVAVAAATVVAAAVVVTSSDSGAGPGPAGPDPTAPTPSSLAPVAAHTVSWAGDGAVLVRIRRLVDADALERALADHGIDARVSFDRDRPAKEPVFADTPPLVPFVPVEGGDGNGVVGLPDPSQQVPPNPDGSVAVGPDLPVDPDGCGTEAVAGLTRDAEGWELLVPAGSPLLERPLSITTTRGDQIGVSYPGTRAGSRCRVITADAPR